MSTPIKRHVKVKGEANPYDPTYETYFEEREGAHMLETFRGTRTLRYLWYEQRGLCTLCNTKITRITGWRLHYCVPRAMGVRQLLATAFYFIPSAMTGFIVSVFPFRNRVSSKEAFEGLELGERKLSRPVLRGPGGRKVAWLLGNCSGPEVGLGEVWRCKSLSRPDLLEARFRVADHSGVDAMFVNTSAFIMVCPPGIIP